MPDGMVICHKSATQTFIDVLKEIGPSNYDRISVENCHLPLLSKEIYPQYKDWMKPVIDGWFVNAQSDTNQKYMQLMAIKGQLGIDMNVEIGTDFETSNLKLERTRKPTDSLLVIFPDGTIVASRSPIDAFINSINKITPEAIKRKEISYKGKQIITFSKVYNGQIQVGEKYWFTVPGQTKDKYKMLQIISMILKLNLKIAII